MAISPEHLAELLDRHAAALELYARQWWQVPEDVVQDAFVRLAAEEPEPRHPRAWLYRVVRNEALTRRRAAGRRRRYEAEARVENWFEPSFGDALDGQTATRALQQLPDEQREVILVHIWGGLTFEEIAELTGTSSSTAHRRFVAALEALRRMLGVTWLSQKN